VLFKYFSNKEDRECAELMVRGVEMHSDVRHRKGVMGSTNMAEKDGEVGVLGKEQSGEGSGSGSKAD
jgi:hypothetical protein